jgi:hypothetical protein
MPVILGGNTGIYLASLAPAVDPDAQAFITAASITDPTQQSAINQLVVDLKGYGIWTKMKALYPFVGGTASTHKFNLKDPRDLDAAFRLVFSGGWTHSSTGVTPNGTNGYADTKLSPSGVLTLNNTHISLYSRTNNAVAGADFANAESGGRTMGFNIKWSDNNGYYDMYNQSTNRITYSMASTNSTGLFVNNRTSNVVHNIWRNGGKLSTNTNTQSGTLTTLNLFIAAQNASAGIAYYTNRNYSFASIGDGLSDTEAANFYTAVQAFQVALSRNI